MTVNPLFVLFGIIGGVLLLMVLILMGKKNKEEEAKPSLPVQYIGSTYRYVTHRSAETNRRDEANRSTNSNDHIVNMGNQPENLQQNEISQPPPPYFRDSDLPQYARNV